MNETNLGGSPFSPPDWIGECTDDDRRAIERLRDGQAAAIVAGDAAGYAALCADDVRLMIPAHDPVIGRDAVLRCEENLFRTARFTKFQKFPDRVLVDGGLAVETGLQSVVVEKTSETTGVFASNQKYVHVFRRTSNGWKFAVLTSNACS